MGPDNSSSSCQSAEDNDEEDEDGGGPNRKRRVGKKGSIKKSSKKRRVTKERAVVESDIHPSRRKPWWEELADLPDWFGLDGGFKGLPEPDLYGFKVLAAVVDKDKAPNESS